MGQKRDEVFTVPKAKSLKPKQGERSKTVVVKVMYELEGGPATTGVVDSLGMWSAVINWKQAGIINQKILAWSLADITRHVYKQVKDKLIDLMGRVQEVDVIFKMPVAEDIKATITFKDAIKDLS